MDEHVVREPAGLERGGGESSISGTGGRGGDQQAGGVVHEHSGNHPSSSGFDGCAHDIARRINQRAGDPNR